MAKINYTQQEENAIASLQTGETVALNIKRINPSKQAPDIKNYSIEVRQKLAESTNGSFNLLGYMNPNNPAFTSSSGVRVGWMTVSAEQAVSLFGVNSNELDSLPIDGGVTRLFIGKKNPSFTMPDGSTKFLQLQIVAKLLSEFDVKTQNGKYKHDNVLKLAKKAGANGRYIKGLNKETGEIEYIIEETVVKSSTMVNDVLVKDNWDHIIIDEYVGEAETKTVSQSVETMSELPTL
tara:strand:- start:408 stop:1115 length:708 start_codon:yes stop_codon:yes gene_type:complete